MPLFALGAVGLIVAYGSARIMLRGFEQLRDVVFAVVGQRALRRLALKPLCIFTACRCAIISRAKRVGLAVL